MKRALTYSKYSIQDMVFHMQHFSKNLSNGRTWEVSHLFKALKAIAQPAVLILFFLFSTLGSAWAQKVYPVRTSIAVKYPSIFVSDFAKESNTTVTITLLDGQASNYPVKLALEASSGTNTYKTDGFLMDVILNGNEPYTLSDFELEKLFSLKENTATTTTFAEGIYQFKIIAYDGTLNLPTNVDVSNANTGFTTMELVRFDPPLLNTIVNGENVKTGNVAQNLFFSWTPRQLNIDPALQIKYKLKIVKLQSPDDIPYMAIQNTNDQLARNNGGGVQDGLNVPLFVYGPEELLMTTGSTFAWQVTAYEGAENAPKTDRFKNQGASEVFVFTIDDNCAQPICTTYNNVLKVEKPVGGGDFEEYEVAYRLAGSNDPFEYLYRTPFESDTLMFTKRHLLPNTFYEVMVRARCTARWLDVQGAGVVRVYQATDCQAPYPVTISTNDASKLELKWDVVPTANSYTVYMDGAALSPVSQNTSTTSPKVVTTTLAPLATATTTYKISIKSTCGTLTASSPDYDIKRSDIGILGDCIAPQPVSLKVQNIDDKAVNVSWNSLSFHKKANDFSYRLKGNTDPFPIFPELSSTTNSVQIKEGIQPSVIYEYQLKYVCDNNKYVLVKGYFSREPNTTVVIEPTTGNCFPPAASSAEVKEYNNATDKGLVALEWDGTEGASEYQIFFKKEGNERDSVYYTLSKSAKLKDLPKGKYEYKIRSKCEDGKYSIFSEKGSFDMDHIPNGCDSIAAPVRAALGSTEIKLRWQHQKGVTSAEEATEYIITYRDATQSIKDEYKQTIKAVDYPLMVLNASNILVPNRDSVSYTVTNLAPDTKYLFSIRSNCSGKSSRGTNFYEFKTTKDAARPTCEGGVNLCNSSVTTLWTAVNKLERVDQLTTTPDINTQYKFQAGEFKVIAKDRANNAGLYAITCDASGIFSGIGYMDLPVVGQDLVRMQVELVNVKINTENCMIAGEIQIKGVVKGEAIADIINQVDEVSDQIRTSINAVKEGIDKVQEGLDAADNATKDAYNYFQGGVGTGGVTEPGGSNVGAEVVTTDPNSGYSGDKPAVLEYNNQVYHVSNNGTVTSLGTQLAAPLTEAERVLNVGSDVVTFEAFGGATYAFDEWKDEYAGKFAIEPEYEKIKAPTTGGADYYVASKLTVQKEIDKVKVKIPSAYTGKVTFVNGKGFQYPIKTSGNESYLQIVGGPRDDAQEIYAIYDNAGVKKTVGKLLVPSYELHTRELVLVPVVTGDPSITGTKITSRINEAYRTKIDEELNKVYGPVGVKYTVTLDLDYDTKQSYEWDTDKNNLLTQSGSKLTSNDYSGEEAAIIKDYVTKQSTSYTTDKAYFFMIDQAGGAEGNLLGKMQFKEQFGFLYAAAIIKPELLTKTIAHELGHGEYFLDHTYKDDIGLSAGTSNNLMDSLAKGLSLIKFQWDVIHAPGHVWGILRSDDDQELITVAGSDLNVLKPLRNADNKTITFVTPAGYPFTLNFDELKSINFSYDDPSQDDDAPVGTYTPNGSLFGFTLKNEKKYSAFRTQTLLGVDFVGYRETATGDSYIDSKSKLVKDFNVCIGVPQIVNKQIMFKVRKVKYRDTYGLAFAQEYLWVSGDHTGTGAFVNSLKPLTMPDIEGKPVLSLGRKTSAENTAFLEINEGAFNDYQLRGIKAISDFILANPGVFTMYFDCTPSVPIMKPFSKIENSEQSIYVYNGRNADLTPRYALTTYSLSPSHPERYEKFMLAYLKNLKAFKDGAKPFAGTWKSELDIMLTNTSLRQSELIAHLSKVRCLDKNYRDVYKEISVNNRLYMLEVIAKQSIRDHWIVFANDAESYISDLFLHIKDEDICEFIEALETKTVTIGSGTSAQTVYLFERIVDQLDGDDYKDLMTAITQITVNCQTKADELADENNVINRTVNWTMGNRKTDVGGIFIKQTPDIDDIIADPLLIGKIGGYITFSNNMVTIKRVQKIRTWPDLVLSTTDKIQTFTYYSFEETDDLVLKPFDLVWLTSDIAIDNDDKIVSGKFSVVPAIVLKYMSDKLFNKNAIQAAELTMDAVSMVSTLGAFSAMTKVGTAIKTKNSLQKARKAYMLYELSTDAIDMAIKAGDLENDPEYKTAVGIFNTITSITGVLDMSNSLYKNRTNLGKAFMKTTYINAFDLSKANLKKSLQSIATLLENYKGKALDNQAKARLTQLETYFNACKSKWATWYNGEAFPNFSTSVVTFFKNLNPNQLFKSSDGKILFKNASKTTVIAEATTDTKYIVNTSEISTAVGVEVGTMAGVELSYRNPAGEIVFIEKGDLKITKLADGTCVVSSGTLCITANTPVRTQQGYKAAQDVKENDLVLSYDQVHKTNVFQKVKAVQKSFTNKLTKLVVGVSTLLLTSNHPVYANGTWTNAGDLKINDTLLTEQGHKEPVKAISEFDTNATVYNYTVDETHTYYAAGILVHNDCKWKVLRDNLGLTSAGKNRLTELVGIATTTLTPAQRSAFYDKLITLTAASAADAQKLVDDLLATPSSIIDFIKEPKFIDAWKTLNTANRATNVRSNVAVLGLVVKFTANSDAAKIDKVLNKIIAFSTSGGTLNTTQLSSITNDFINVYLTDKLTITGRANLMDLFDASSDISILNTIKAWPDDSRNGLLNNLQSQPGQVSNGNSSFVFIGNRLSSLDAEMLENFKKFTDKKVAQYKKYGYEFLSGSKGLKSEADFDDYLNLSTAVTKADELRPLFPNVANLILDKTYRTNLFSRVNNLFAAGGTNLDNFIKMYKEDKDTYAFLNGLKGKSTQEIADGLDSWFKGADFNAHHIIPRNLLYNNAVCKDIMEWAVRTGKPFKFHDIDNLIFLRNINHTGGTFGHNVYDLLISDEILTLGSVFSRSPQEAFDGLVQIVTRYEQKIIDQLIGSTPSKKLDQLQ